MTDKSSSPRATQCPSCGKGNQSAQCWNCGCDWSLPSETAWITCPATGKQCNDYCDPGKGDNCADSGQSFTRSATGPSTDDSRDARRYRTIREHGIPCSAADDCGSCTGDELDAQIDDAITNPEKYDV